MSYHEDLINKARESKYSFLEIYHEEPTILQLRVDNMTIRQIKSQIKRLKNIKKIGLVSNSKDEESNKLYKLVTSYSPEEDLTCSMIDESDTITKVSYVSNSIFDSVLMQEKENSTVH